MDVIRLSPSVQRPAPSVATVGFFDGVHRGHRYLLAHVCDVAHGAGLRAMAVTFDSHPRRVLRSDYRPELLSTTDEKLALLAQTGIDACALLHFDEQMASLSARDFMGQVLLGRLGVRSRLARSRPFLSDIFDKPLRFAFLSRSGNRRSSICAGREALSIDRSPRPAPLD